MDPIRGVAGLNEGTWEEFRVALSAVLRDLLESEVLTIEVSRRPDAVAGSEPRAARPSFWARFSRAARDNDPNVSFRRLANVLCCVCSGPVEDGGWVRLTQRQQTGIRDLGWDQASQRNGDNWAYPNYRAYFPHHDGALSQPPRDLSSTPYCESADADRAAGLAVDTLRGPLNATTPRDLRVNRAG